MKALYGKQVAWCKWTCSVFSEIEGEYCVPSELSYFVSSICKIICS